jgi:hypothetical protein
MESRIKRLIEEPLSNKFLPCVGSEEEEWSDSVSVQIGSTYEEDRRYFRGNPDATPEGLTLRRLGHLVVNPNDQWRTEAIINSYVYATGTDQPNHANIEGNDQKLIEYLITEAKTQREAFEQERSLHTTKYMILHGEKGCGKTCFQNFLLSKYSGKLDENQAIWVRLNLATSLGYENDLKGWILAQTMKIVCRYYDPESFSFDRSPNNKKKPIRAGAHLIDFINKRYGSSRRDRMLNVADSILDSLYDIEKEQDLVPDVLPKSFSMEIHKHVLNEGYSLIIVLDGLDQLELTRDSQEVYASLVSQADNLLTSLTSSREFYVLVSRTSTIKEKGIPFIVGSERIDEIRPVPIIDIIDKRLDHIKREIKSLSISKGWNYRDQESLLIEFYNYLQTNETVYRERGSINGPILTFLDEYFHKNKRAAVQLIQVYFYDFLKHRGRKNYYLIENLMKCGKAYPIKPYRYVRDASGQIAREKAQHKTFDNIFLTNIFTSPIINKQQSSGLVQEPNNFNNLLIGLRIMQIIASHDRYRKERPERKIKALHFEDLLEICDVLFEYPRDLVSTILDEYIETQYVAAEGRVFLHPANIEDARIIILPKTLLILENFLFEIAYLNLASMRVPLPIRLIETEMPYFRFIRFKHPFVYLHGVAYSLAPIAGS